MKKMSVLFMIVALLISLSGCYQQVFLVDQDLFKETEETATEAENTSLQQQFSEISIIGVGDIMVHGPQLRAQYNSATKTYDFTNNFRYVEQYLKASDLVIGNLETTFGGEDRGYSSYPMFNTPDELATALKQAGLHVLSTANNHTFDTGKKGILRTLEVLKGNQLIPVGTRSEEDEKGYYITEINGIQVGVSGFTYETPRWGEYKTLNALKIPKDVEALIDTFSYEYLQEDLVKIKERIDLMKQEGAEVIVVNIHWGNEYQRRPNDYQKHIADALADYGVDIIFGSHPHVLQPIEMIQSSYREEPTLVVYSLGNFLSNQRYEILSNRYTEDGLIVNVRLEKDLINNKVRIKEISYMPTWIHRFHRQGKIEYEILPLFDALANEEAYYLVSKDSKWRAQNSLKNTQEIIKVSYDKIVPLNMYIPYLEEFKGELQ